MLWRAVASGLTAPEVWDAIPFLAKLQIIGAIGIFEHISEDKNLCAAAPSLAVLVAARRMPPA